MCAAVEVLSTKPGRACPGAGGRMERGSAGGSDYCQYVSAAYVSWNKVGRKKRQIQNPKSWFQIQGWAHTSLFQGWDIFNGKFSINTLKTILIWSLFLNLIYWFTYFSYSGVSCEFKTSVGRAQLLGPHTIRFKTQASDNAAPPNCNSNPQKSRVFQLPHNCCALWKKCRKVHKPELLEVFCLPSEQSTFFLLKTDNPNEMTYKVLGCWIGGAARPFLQLFF